VIALARGWDGLAQSRGTTCYACGRVGHSPGVSTTAALNWQKRSLAQLTKTPPRATPFCAGAPHRRAQEQRKAQSGSVLGSVLTSLLGSGSEEGEDAVGAAHDCDSASREAGDCMKQAPVQRANKRAGDGGGGEEEEEEEEEWLSVMAVTQGHTQGVAYTRRVDVPRTADFAALRPTLEAVSKVYKTDHSLKSWPDRWTPPQWQLFDTGGLPVNQISRLIDGGGGGRGGELFLLMEGGAWVWPGIEKGFVRELTFHDRALKMVTLELQPLIVSIDGFLTETEVATVIQKAGPHVRPSGVTMNDRDRAAGRKNSDFRTSETHWLHSREAWLQNIDKRVANLTRTPVHYQEAVQVLRYQHGQYYGAHLDYTNRLNYGKNEAKMQRMHGTYHNRMATVFWYLSDVTKGGTTHFARAGGAPHPHTTRNCEGGGVHVTPKAGRGIIFYSLTADGFGDEFSLHASCPVLSGETKWAANKWVHNTPMNGM
jgi:prolyl 4-hydroxylase